MLGSEELWGRNNSRMSEGRTVWMAREESLQGSVGLAREGGSVGDPGKRGAGWG